MSNTYCDDSSYTALCYRVGSAYYRSTSSQCPAGHEAVATVAADSQRRRLGANNNKVPKGDKKAKPKKEKTEEGFLEVDIEGETWTIFLGDDEE